MSNYSKVQVLSWDICTGPNQSSPLSFSGINGTTTDGRLDVIAQVKDIEARVAFTQMAIEAALVGADPSPNILKVFIAPEFLYRSANGPYLRDLVDGWKPGDGTGRVQYDLPKRYHGAWGGLVGTLRDLVGDQPYADWVFVFGSLISASFPKFKNAEDIYAFDRDKLTEVDNATLIQRGADKRIGSWFVAHKRFEHWPTFVNDTLANTSDWNDDERDSSDQLRENNPIFCLSGVLDSIGTPIRFGIERGTEHDRRGGNQYGRVRASGQRVRLQLIQSCGTQLNADSIHLLPNSHAIYCDGGEDRASTVGSAKTCAIDATTVIDVDGLETIKASQLWSIAKTGNESESGAGQVHISNVMDL